MHLCVGRVTVLGSCVPGSPQLQLDERDQKVRAVPEKRCILILREVPDGATEEVGL